MQTLHDIKALLAAAAFEPRKALGQNFLIDGNLMAKLLELAAVPAGTTVLEVGPGTGGLTEELLARGARVVAVEMDAGLADVLRDRLADRPNFTLIHRDALDGKHALAAEILAAIRVAWRAEPLSPREGGRGEGLTGAHLVSNLPYNAAVPIILNCLRQSWEAISTAEKRDSESAPVLFARLTFTVQRELAARLLAPPGGADYGPASILVALTTRATPGRGLPPEAFWPRPTVRSQMLRLDFDPALAGRIPDWDTLARVLSACFSQRRKKISAAPRVRTPAFAPDLFARALAAADIDPGLRPQQVPPNQYLALAARLGGGARH